MRQLGILFVSTVQVPAHRLDQPLLCDGQEPHGAPFAVEVAVDARKWAITPGGPPSHSIVVACVGHAAAIRRFTAPTGTRIVVRQKGHRIRKRSSSAVRRHRARHFAQSGCGQHRPAKPRAEQPGRAQRRRLPRPTLLAKLERRMASGRARSALRVPARCSCRSGIVSASAN